MKIELFKHTLTDGWSPALQSQLDSNKTLVLVFGASSYHAEKTVFNALQSTFPTSLIAGCSTAGEIFGIDINDDSLAVAVLRFDNTRLQKTEISVTDHESSYDVGLQLTQSLNQPGLKGLLILSDGLTVNGSELLRGINKHLPDSVVVTGGLAGDGDRFERTWVLRQSVPASAYVTAIAYYGDKIQIRHGSKGGWESFGPRRLISKSKGNILYELDDKPALALYKDYLGKRASGLPATALLFPLAIHDKESDSGYIVRTILSVDEANQSLIFAGDIPQGKLAQLMQADFERLIDGASDAALMASAHQHVNGDILNIAISCVGRRLVLGERSEEEIEAALDVLPENTKQIGFYSYGEISPLVNGSTCQLHNQTMTLTTLSELE